MMNLYSRIARKKRAPPIIDDEPEVSSDDNDIIESISRNKKSRPTVPNSQRSNQQLKTGSEPASNSIPHPPLDNDSDCDVVGVSKAVSNSNSRVVDKSYQKILDMLQ
jgi:hypothetical protein